MSFHNTSASAQLNLQVSGVMLAQWHSISNAKLLITHFASSTAKHKSTPTHQTRAQQPMHPNCLTFCFCHMASASFWAYSAAAFARWALSSRSLTLCWRAARAASLPEWVDASCSASASLASRSRNCCTCTFTCHHTTLLLTTHAEEIVAPNIPVCLCHHARR